MGENSYIWAIIAAILYVVSSVKKNFDKEQEKARKRNPQVPVEMDEPAKTVVIPTRNETPRPVTPSQPRRRNLPSERPIRTQTEKTRRRAELPPLPDNDVFETIRPENYPSTSPIPATHRVDQPEKMKHRSLKEERNAQIKRQVEIPEEVLKLRAYKEQKKREAEKYASKSRSKGSLNLNKAVELSIIGDENSPQQKIDFDLEKAVLYSAILERKYV